MILIKTDNIWVLWCRGGAWTHLWFLWTGCEFACRHSPHSSVMEGREKTGQRWGREMIVPPMFSLWSCTRAVFTKLPPFINNPRSQCSHQRSEGNADAERRQHPPLIVFFHRRKSKTLQTDKWTCSSETWTQNQLCWKVLWKPLHPGTPPPPHVPACVICSIWVVLMIVVFAEAAGSALLRGRGLCAQRD